VHPVITSCDSSDVTCRRFEQIVSQYTTRIGCASSLCSKSRSMLVCLFSQSHPSNTQLYTNGEPCSRCANGFEMCLKGSLCVSSSYCTTFAKHDKSTSCSQSSTQKKEHAANKPSLLPFEGFNDTPQADDALQNAAEAVECTDKRTECADWAQAGYCESDSVIENCPLSCQKCAGGGDKLPSVLETTVELSQAGGCIDQHPNCAEWAKTPINCQSPYLKENCQRACGFCVILESTPPPPKIKCNISEVTYCTQIALDKEKNCAAYPKYGNCVLLLAVFVEKPLQ
jgi:hypothetical protein